MSDPIEGSKRGGKDSDLPIVAATEMCGIPKVQSTRHQRYQMSKSLLGKCIKEMLDVEGFDVVAAHWETPDGQRCWPMGHRPRRRDAVLVIEMTRRWQGRCPSCLRRCKRVHERLGKRRWRELPTMGHPTVLEYAPQRLFCEHCQRTQVELLPWAEPYQRETRRFQQHLALQAASMPTQHVAVLHAVSWHTVRRAERAAYERWQATREPTPLTMVGVDEKYLGRGGKRRYGTKFVTIISNLQTGEPLWIGKGRGKEPVYAWLETLTDQQIATIKLFSMDLAAGYTRAVLDHPKLKHVAIVHDPFHVIKLANKALDELRRETFFRASSKMRAVGKGKRWLLLRAWDNCTEKQQFKLKSLFRYNRRLANAYQIVEQLRETLRAPSEIAMIAGLEHVLKRTERRANKPMRKLHDTLNKHFWQIVSLGRFHAPTGRVEALNNNWETAVRKARGYLDLDFLLLKLRFMTVNPIANDYGTSRFLALGLPPSLPNAA